MKKISLFLAVLVFSTAAVANVVGTHFENFNPTTNGLDFVTVHSSKTLDPGVFNLGGFGNYSFNSLPFYKAAGVPNTQKFSEPNDKLLSSVAHIGLGISKGWDVGISLPFILDQNVKNNTNLGTFSETGLTEVRMNTKIRLVNEDDWGLAFIGSVNFDRIKNNPFTGSNSGPTFNFEGALDYKIAPRWLLALNAGYRLRDPGNTILDTAVTPMTDQILYSAALAYQWTENGTWMFEAYGSSFTETVNLPTDRKQSNLEALIGYKHMLKPTLALHAGIAAGTYHGLSSPDARIYAGLNWQVGPIWDREPAPVVQEPVVYRAPIEEEEPPSETIVLSSINFSTGVAEMNRHSQAAFAKTTSQLRKNVKTIRKIIVEGHTDNVGKDDYNLKLSDARAKSVQKILLKALPELDSKIHSIGLGENRPIASNDSESGRTKNRRVEIKIYRTE